MLAVATQKHADMGGSIASAVKKRMTVPDISAIPPRFRRAFKAALQPDPSQRPQTMLAFIKLMDSRAETEKLSTFVPLNSDAKPTAVPEALETSDKLNLEGRGKIIGAAIGAVVLIGVLSVFMMMRGTTDTVSGESVVITDPAITTPAPPRDTRLTAAMIETALSETRCSWLEFESRKSLGSFNPETDTLKMLGGTGNIDGAGSAIAESLRRRIRQDVNVDLSEVAKFNPRLCDVVGALQDIKSPTPFISSNAPSRVFEVKTHKVPDGAGGLGKAIYTTISVEVANVDQNKFVSVLSIDPRGLLVPLANGRNEIQGLVDRFGGVMREDGFALTFPTNLTSTEKEGYGFVLITGDSEFPPTFFTDTDSQGGFPVSQGWLSQFNSLARSNNWTSDIFWYSVVDEIDD